MGEGNAREADTNSPNRRYANQPERELSPDEFNMLSRLAENVIETISYHKPGRNLSDFATDRAQFLKIIRGLESLGVVAFDPSLKDGFLKRGGYKVNKEKAKTLYLSYLEAQKAKEVQNP